MFKCMAQAVCVRAPKLTWFGRQQLIKNRWLLAYMSILLISFVDLFVSLSMGCNEVNIKQFPFTLMKG